MEDVTWRPEDLQHGRSDIWKKHNKCKAHLDSCEASRTEEETEDGTERKQNKQINKSGAKGRKWRERKTRVRIKQEMCFHVHQSAVIQVIQSHSVCVCELQASRRWMIMACLAVSHLQRLCSILFPVNISGSSLADLSAVILFNL